jgi:hypothetical protein
MSGMAQPQFDIDTKVVEVENLKARIEEIGNLLEPTLDSAPGYLQPMIQAYFQRINGELQAEEVKIQGIEANIKQYKENQTRINTLEAQKAQVEASIAQIRTQIEEVGKEVYRPTAGGTKKKRKIDTKSIKMKKSSMKKKSSKSKDIRKIKKNKDKK